ncbi:MAG: hypothetical protein VKJ27_03250 [Synechocystis sp.]|nr:hypothetical protein [Synechocystis sp.]
MNNTEILACYSFSDAIYTIHYCPTRHCVELRENDSIIISGGKCSLTQAQRVVPKLKDVLAGFICRRLRSSV